MDGGLVVYGDLFLLVNTLVDGVLLVVAVRLAQLPLHPWRLALAALLGGGYALGAFYLPAIGYGLIGKVAASVVLCALAAGTTRLAALGRVVAYFYVAAFVVAGLTLGLSGLAGLPWSGAAVPWWGVSGALLLVGVGLRRFWTYAREVRDNQAYRYVLEVACEGRTLRVPALLDTGNRLRDPLTGEAVVLLERQVACRLLPPALAAAVETGETTWDGWLEAVTACDWQARVRILPFETIGQAGQLFGFRVDRLSIERGRLRQMLDSVVVAISDRLSAAGDYQALLPAAALEQAAS